MRILVENICSFFVNGVDTRTQGVDVVANIRNIALMGDYRLNINLSGNYNTVSREGGVRTPGPIAAAGGTIFNRTEESYLLTSRPKYKGVLGLELVSNEWTVNLNNTLFGPTTCVNVDMIDGKGGQRVDDPLSSTYMRLVFDLKVVTDLVVNYKFTETISLNLAINNVLNVVPHYTFENRPAGVSEKDARNAVDFNGRYSITSYDGSHFSINGTTLLASVSVTF